MKLKLLAISLAAFMAAGSVSYADVVFGSGALTHSHPTFVNPGGSTVGTGRHYYDVWHFTVSASGAYTFELSSLNTTGTPSNALDTYFRIYANSFNPLAPAGSIAANDDFTGTLTVLPGPFAGLGLTATATGFTGAQPSSRVLNLNLVAGTQYFFVVTSFRSTDFVGTATTAQPVGNYYFGINGPGVITIVPEPGTTALLGIAAVGLGIAAWRRRKSA